jgi:THO complex subunit 2
MESTRIRWQATTSQSKQRNALLDTVLVDDTAPAASSSQTQESNAPVKLQPPQRIQLLQALLTVGDMPSSLFLLNKYPWVAQSHPLIADLILAFVAHAIEGVYRSLPSQWGSEGEESLDLEAGRVDVSLEAVSISFRPSPPSTMTKSFHYFYPYWENSLEVWESPDDILVLGRRWLSFVRGLGGRDAEVMVKICRVGTAHFVSLRKAKERELGTEQAKSRAELQQVEVSPSLWGSWRYQKLIYVAHG